MFPISIFLFTTALHLRSGWGKSNPRDLLSILSSSPGPGVTGRPQSPNCRVINIACLDAPLPPSLCPQEYEVGKGPRIWGFHDQIPCLFSYFKSLVSLFWNLLPSTSPLAHPTSCFSLNIMPAISLPWPTLSQVWVKEACGTPTSSKVYSDRECLSGSSQSPQHLYRVWKQGMHISKLNAYRREYESTEYLMRGNCGSSGQR